MLTAELLRADRRQWASLGVSGELDCSEAKPVANLYPPRPHQAKKNQIEIEAYPFTGLLPSFPRWSGDVDLMSERVGVLNETSRKQASKVF